VRLRLAQDLSRREHAGVTESQLAAIRRSTCSGRPLGSQEFNSSREKEIRRRWRPKTRTVPLSYFIENSFQKWTRESADILGTAFVYVDYSIPVEELRQQLNTTALASTLWDKKLCGRRSPPSPNNSMEIPCLVSSRNSCKNFDTSLP
jgi:hypothetical protein